MLILGLFNNNKPDKADLIYTRTLLEEYLSIWIARHKLWRILIQEDIDRGHVHFVGLVNQENVVRTKFLKVRFPSLITLKNLIKYFLWSL
jgi:hypothetical protein